MAKRLLHVHPSDVLAGLYSTMRRCNSMHQVVYNSTCAIPCATCHSAPHLLNRCAACEFFLRLSLRLRCGQSSALFPFLPKLRHTNIALVVSVSSSRLDCHGGLVCQSAVQHSTAHASDQPQLRRRKHVQPVPATRRAMIKGCAIAILRKETASMSSCMCWQCSPWRNHA